MLSIKPGAQVLGLKAEILLALVVVSGILKSYGVDAVLTEATGGEHMQGSLHYAGEAIDVRSHDVPADKKAECLLRIQHVLGDDYQVILEDLGSPNEHLHLQFKPRST